VHGAQGVIDNGGFRYFFENDWPGRPPYSFFSKAYRRIGAARAAQRIEQAVASLPYRRPHLAARGRNRFMNGLAEDDPFFALDREVCGDVTIWAKLERFVEKNRAGLTRRPLRATRQKPTLKK
jgi:hypothetical protein